MGNHHKYTFGQHPQMPWKEEQACDPWEGLTPWQRWVEIQRLRYDNLDKQFLAMRILAAIVFLALVVLLRSLR